MKKQPKLIATAITAALLAGAVHAAEAGAITTAVLAGAVPAKPVYHAAESAGGGQPTSTPTHTVPVKPTDQLTIKTKSSPPFAPQIEDEKKTSTTDAHGLTGHEGHPHARGNDQSKNDPEPGHGPGLGAVAPHKVPPKRNDCAPVVPGRPDTSPC